MKHKRFSNFFFTNTIQLLVEKAKKFTYIIKLLVENTEEVHIEHQT